jgi:hypothetical protein
MKKIWLRKAKSFSEAQEQDLDYYLNMSAQERLETVQFLRERYPKFGRVKLNESGKRLRRTVRIVQLKNHNHSQDKADLEMLEKANKKRK